MVEGRNAGVSSPFDENERPVFAFTFAVNVRQESARKHRNRVRRRQFLNKKRGERNLPSCIMLPRKLNILDKQKLITHLQSLKGEDRRLRFGMVATDEYIETYVSKSLEDSNSKWFGVDHIDGQLVAACHAAIINDMAELGCSVDKEYRGHKLAQYMFDRAVTWLRTRGIQDVCMHCLAENAIMKHIARKNDMAVITEDGESDANVHLQPANAFTPLADNYADRMALYDMMLRKNIQVIRSFMPKYWYESKSN